MPNSYSESKELSLPCVWYLAFEDESMCCYFQYPAMPHFNTLLVSPSDPVPGLTNKNEILGNLESCYASSASS